MTSPPEPPNGSALQLLGFLGDERDRATYEARLLADELYARLTNLRSALTELGPRLQASDWGVGEASGDERVVDVKNAINAVDTTYHSITEFESSLTQEIKVLSMSMIPSGAVTIRFIDLIPRFQIDSILNDISTTLEELLGDPSPNQIIDSLIRFRELLRSVEERSYPETFEAIMWARRHLGGYEIRMTQGLSQALNSYVLRKSEDYAQASVKNLQGLSGKGASIEQKKTVLELSKDEATLSKSWTAGVFGFVTLGILAPIIVFSFDVQISNVASWAGVLIKLAISLPLFGIAAYCGRVAAQHRELARHMKLLAVQIDTIEPYIEKMNDQQKSEMRMFLGRRLFSSVDLEVKDSGNISVIPTEVIPLLEKAMDIGKDAVNKRGA